VCTDKEFVAAVLGDASKSFTNVNDAAGTAFKMSRRTTMRYLNRLTEAGIITTAEGVCLVAKEGEPK
jgi:hypothetical protein